MARGISGVINLIAETQSEDTAQSADRTATILRTNGITHCVAVSDAYHMFRVKQFLQSEGLVVYVSPGRIPFLIPVMSASRRPCGKPSATCFGNCI